MAVFDPRRLAQLLASLAPARRCWVAFSGGMDSMVLLDAAAEVREQLPGALWAVHVDHGLQPQAPDWAEQCSTFCLARSIPIVIRQLNLTPQPGESVEAVAREARRGVFVELLEADDLLLTAHHEDDQAETLLLALLRGSGVRGLAAMPFSTRLGKGCLVRPLLGYRHAELADYAARRGLTWVEDPSNAETAMDRNFLRHRLVPLARARWPALSTTLARSARHCAEAAGLVDGLAEQTLLQIPGALPGSLHIPLLMQLERPLAKAVLRSWLGWGGFALPDTRHLERILDEVLAARSDANPLVAWTGCEVRRYREDLCAIAPLPEVPSVASQIGWQIDARPAALDLPSGLGRLAWRPHSVADERAPGQGASSADLDIRFGQSGHLCRPSSAGRQRSLKKLFQEAGVPSWLRGYVPMIFQDGALIAIAGISACTSASWTGPDGDLSWIDHPWGQLSGAGMFRETLRIQTLGARSSTDQ